MSRRLVLTLCSLLLACVAAVSVMPGTVHTSLSKLSTSLEQEGVVKTFEASTEYISGLWGHRGSRETGGQLMQGNTAMSVDITGAQGSAATGAETTTFPTSAGPAMAPSDGVITVSTRAELMDAVRAATGGETIALSGGNYGAFNFYAALSDTVTLRSASAEDPAVFSGLDLRGAANLTFEDVIFDYTSAPGAKLWTNPFEIHGGHDIAFHRVVFDGDDAHALDAASDGYPTGVGLYVTGGARDVTVADSVVTGFWKGVRLVDVDSVAVTGTEFTDIRADGLNLVQVRDILVEDNHFHDFRLAPDSGDHRDMIQAWTRRTTESSEGITIRGNLFDIGEGGRTQTVYFDQAAETPDLPFRDVVIEENVIVNAHASGIKIGRTEGLSIAHNTVLQGVIEGEGVSHAAINKPRIIVDPDSTDVVLSHNAAYEIKGYENQPDWAFENNFHIQREAPGAWGHYADNFVAALDDATNAPANIQVLPGSPLDLSGAGAARLTYDATPEALTALVRSESGTTLNRVAFDAGLSAGPDGAAADSGASFAWDFGDGTTGTGVAPEHVYGAPGLYTATLTVTLPDGSRSVTATEVRIDGPDLLRFDAVTGALQAQYADRSVALDGVTTTTLEDGSHAIVLGDGDIEMPFKALDGLYGADHFSIAMSLRMPTGSPGAGEVFVLPKSLSVRVTEKGEVAVSVQAEGTTGWQWVGTSGARIVDGQWHDIGIDWDDATGLLTITVDGIERGSGVVNGTLKGAERWEPMLGSPWDKAFDGEVRAFEVSVNEGAWEEAALAAPPPAPEPVFYGTQFAFVQDQAIEAPAAPAGAAGPAPAPSDTAALFEADSFIFEQAPPPAPGALPAGGHSLEYGRSLDLGRLKAFEQSQNLTVEVDFYRTEIGATDRATLVGNHKNLLLEVVDERLRVCIGTADGGMYREYIGRFGLNEDMDLHTLVLNVDAEADIATLQLDDDLVWRLEGVDLQLTGGREWGWNLGSRWGDSTAEMAMTRLAITDNTRILESADYLLA